MLDNFETVFDNMQVLMKRLKKKKYEENMIRFREVNGHFFTEMMELMEESGGSKDKASEIAQVFMEAVKKKFTKWGRIPGYAEVNLTFFTIYYIFPAILLTESPHSIMVADAIQESFRELFKNSNIQYADYQTIHDGFNEKILGIF